MSAKSPTSPADGVYDHCRRTAEMLERLGHSVTLAAPTSVGTIDNYSVIHLHYSPFEFPPLWGAGVVPVAVRLRRSAPLVVTVHEARVDFAFSKQGLGIAPVQTLWLSQLLRSADQVIVPTRRWLPRLLGYTAELIPVGSNLPGEPAPWSNRSRNPRTVGLFGHGLSGVGEEAARCLRDELGWQILVIGQSPTADLPSTGYLDEAMLCRALTSVDLLLLPYHDGATGRRTTFQAALQLGIPVLTTSHGDATDFPFREDAFAWVLASDRSAYVRRAHELALDEGMRVRLSVGARKLFADEFERGRITQRTLEVYRRAIAIRLARHTGRVAEDLAQGQ